MLGIAGILLQKRAREIRAFAMERASVGFAATPQLCGFLLAFGSARPAARIHPGALLSPLIDDDFGVAPFVAVFADQKVVFVRGQAITAVAPFLCSWFPRYTLLSSQKRMACPLGRV